MARPARNSGSLIERNEDTAAHTPGAAWRTSRYASTYPSTYSPQYDLPEEAHDAIEFGRDRSATAARPIVRLLADGKVERSVARSDDLEDTRALALDDTLDALDTLAASDAPTIVPAARQPVILPRARRRPSRWVTIGRALLASLMLYYVLSSSMQLVGYPGLPLAPFPWTAANGFALGARSAATFPLRMDGKVASRVRPMTQMRRLDLYDSKAQFDQWAGAACSAATLAEILTAYGLPHMTIGRMIRELGKDISPNWGLLTYSAFNRVVAKYGLRADVYLSDNPLTYKQMLYLTNTLGIPVVVNMRATTGYYHYLSGGHILVMTGGDSSTIRLTDSSLYYMKSLPLATYNQMARPRNVVIVPKNYHYKLPRG